MIDKIELKKSESEKLEEIFKILKLKQLEVELASNGLNFNLVSILKANNIENINEWLWNSGSSFLFKKQSEMKVENQDGKTAADV